MPPNGREMLIEKMAEVFGSEISNLPEDDQKALLDDMVTAFENRQAVFARVASKIQVPLIMAN